MNVTLYVSNTKTKCCGQDLEVSGFMDERCTDGGGTVSDNP